MNTEGDFVSSKVRSENSKHITDIFLQSATVQWLSDQQFSAYASTTVANDYACPHGTRYVLGSRYDALLAENESLKMELVRLKGTK